MADALVAAGHAADRREAFDRFLGRGPPGVRAAKRWSVREVVASLRVAGGVSSLAHPGPDELDDVDPAASSPRASALEVWHGDHDAATRTAIRAPRAASGWRCPAVPTFTPTTRIMRPVSAP